MKPTLDTVLYELDKLFKQVIPDAIMTDPIDAINKLKIAFEEKQTFEISDALENIEAAFDDLEFDVSNALSGVSSKVQKQITQIKETMTNAVRNR